LIIEKKLTNETTPIHIKSAKNGEVVKMLFRDPNNENKVMLTLEKKVFDYENQETFYRIENSRWVSHELFSFVLNIEI
jgi:hypothetical protein